MSVQDLPEPKRPVYSQDQIDKRNYRLLVTFFVVLTCYSSLHKLIIPLFLKLTHLRNSPYAKVDLWFLHSIFLTGTLRKKRVATITILSAGAAISYGVFETWHVAEGNYPGWLGISKLVSSVPIAIGSVFLLVNHAVTRLDFIKAWLGAIGVAFYFFWWPMGNFSKVQGQPQASVNPPAQSTFREIEVDVPTCGAKQLLVGRLIRPRGGESSVLKVEGCGLSPVVLAGNVPLTLKNETAFSTNLHCVLGRAHTKVHRMGWNLLLPAHSEIQAPQLTLGSDEVALIYSDVKPDWGLTALVPANLTGGWLFQRQPIFIQKVPEK